MLYAVTKWAAIVVLALALTGWIDTWYLVVNYVVFIIGLFGSWIARQKNMHGWTIIIALVAIIFNPFAPPAFFEMYRTFIELGAIIIFFLSPPELAEGDS